MDLELAGKICVVTGASEGIGLAITRALVAEGAVVVAGARSIDSLHCIERVTPVAIDLGSREGPSQLVKRAVNDHGRIDVLVNNVGGVRLRVNGFLGTSDEEFELGDEYKLLRGLTGDASGSDLYDGSRRGDRERGLR